MLKWLKRIIERAKEKKRVKRIAKLFGINTRRKTAKKIKKDTIEKLKQPCTCSKNELREMIRNMTGLQEQEIKIENDIREITIITSKEIKEEVKEEIEIRIPIYKEIKYVVADKNKRKGAVILQELTLGSLFDGIGGFCYAAYLTGRIKPIWAAEIEQNCIDITRYRFPEVMHVGSVTELKGDEIQPVDIITFGSPCQDLSIAGQRKGLKGNRSGLFMEAIRIIEEMRLATNGKYPTFIIWENVPGAFSSANGADFRAVLEKITKTSIPMPTSGEWATAGMVRGAAVDTAWRVLDAQFWGVPQRRKRIYLIGDFGGQRAGEILFKSESVLGYTPKSKEQKQEIAGQFADSVRTENSRAGGEIIGLDFAHADSVVRTFTDKAPTLVQNMGRGGGQTPCVMYEETSKAYGINAKSIIVDEESTGTLSTYCGNSTNRNVVAIEKKNVIPLRDEVTRNKASNGLGVGKVGGPCPTLTTADVHSVFYEAYQHNGYRESEISGTLTADQNSTIRGDTPLVVRTDRKTFELNQHGGYREAEVNGTLRAAGGGLRRRVGNNHNRELQDKGEYP